MTEVIRLEGIDLTLGRQSLFRGADLIIERGGMYALTGPNGSGKSALLRAICGFTPVDAGRVWIDPQYLSRRRTFPEHFGITIDGPAYLPGRTGRENLLSLARIRKQIRWPEIAATMRRVGLDPDLTQSVRDYSLGMKQKLSLAQALMERPEVLLLDEPFNALDAPSVERVKELLREEHSRGVTILFKDLGAEVFRLEHGRIVAR
jgi:ABC-2 type transport system ATP-binding protein